MIGAGIGVVVALIVGGMILFIFCKKKRKPDKRTPDYTPSNIPLIPKASVQTVVQRATSQREKFNEFLEMLDDEETASDMKYLYIPQEELKMMTAEF